MKIVECKGEGFSSCLICGNREVNKLKTISINRLVRNDNVISFDICLDCLQRMDEDIKEIIEK